MQARERGPDHPPTVDEKSNHASAETADPCSPAPDDASIGAQSHGGTGYGSEPRASAGPEPHRDMSGLCLEGSEGVSGLSNAFVEEGLHPSAPQDLAGLGPGLRSAPGTAHVHCRYPSDASCPQTTGVCQRADIQHSDEPKSPEEPAAPRDPWQPQGSVCSALAIGFLEKGMAETTTPGRAWSLEVAAGGGTTTRAPGERDFCSRMLESKETVFQTVVSHCISPTASTLSQDTEVSGAVQCSSTDDGPSGDSARKLDMYRTGASQCLSPDVCSLSEQRSDTEQAWAGSECGEEASQPLTTVFQTVVSHCLSPAASSLSDWASDGCGQLETPPVLPSDSIPVPANPLAADGVTAAASAVDGVPRASRDAEEPPMWTGDSREVQNPAAGAGVGGQLVMRPCGAQPAGPSAGSSSATAPGSPCLLLPRAAGKGSPAVDAGKRLRCKVPANEGSICTSRACCSSREQPLPQSQWNAYLFSTAETLSTVDGDEADFEDMWDAAADAQMSFTSALNC